MRSKDLVEGVDYLWRESKYDPGSRVEVVKVGATREVPSRWPNLPPKIERGLVEIRLLDTDPERVKVVRPVELVCTWAEYEQAAQRDAQERARREERQREARAARARELYALDRLLRQHGATPEAHLIRSGDAHAALLAAGFTVAAPDEERTGWVGGHRDPEDWLSATFPLADAMNPGTVPVDALRVLLPTGKGG